MDAHAHKLSQGPLANPPSAQHPLASLLSDLHYAPWQLEATPPQAPKVSMTNSSMIVGMTNSSVLLGTTQASVTVGMTPFINRREHDTFISYCCA